MTTFATLDGDGPVRIVVVGAGNMAQHWLRVIAESPEVMLVGLVDLDVELATEVAKSYSSELIVGSSLTQVAHDSAAQAVINVTVPNAHRSVNMEALFAGLPVLCEKPITPKVADALALIAATEITGQLLMTSQSRRYYPHLATLKDILPTLGQVGILTTEFFTAPHFGGFREEMTQPLLLDMAIHAFDVSRYLLDANPVSVQCQTFNPAWSWYRGDAAATAVFEFENGAKYSYTGSWCSPGRTTSWNGNWRVSGALGAAIWDGENEPVVEYADSTPRVHGHRSTIRSEIAGSLDEFVNALTTGQTPSGEVHSNIYSLAMVEAAVLSTEQRRTVSIASVLRDGYIVSIKTETRDDLRAALKSWGSASMKLCPQSSDEEISL